MNKIILLFLGGGLGTIIRWGVSGLIATIIGEIFPFGTIFVNITGAFAIGFVATLTSSDGRIFLHSDIRQFLMIGVLGGYTTFSSFSLQTFNLIQDNEIFLACANVIISVILCLLAVWLGHIMASKINSLNWF